MEFDRKRWQSRRKISFKKVEVKSPYENFLLSQYLNDLAKACGKDGWVTLWKKKVRTTTSRRKQKMECPKCKKDIAYKNGGNIRKDGTKVPRYYCPARDKTFQTGKK